MLVEWNIFEHEMLYKARDILVKNLYLIGGDCSDILANFRIHFSNKNYYSNCHTVSALCF